MTREADERLRDILHAVARIESHTRALQNASYERDPAEADVYKDAVHYQLIVIGEAIAALPDEVKAMDPEIPWKAIVGLRNRLAHEYFLIDPAAIREVVEKDLAELATRVRRLTGG